MKEANLKRYCMIPTIQCFEKCKTMETVRRSVMVRDKMERWGEGVDEQVDHRGFEGQWNFTVWYHNVHLRVLKLLSHVQTLCDAMDWKVSGSSVHGIFQGKILDWVTTFFSRASSQPRDWTWVSHIAGILYSLSHKESHTMVVTCYYLYVQTTECTTQRGKHNISYGVWVIMMHQCRFINFHKYTSLMGDVDKGRSYSWMGAGSR